MATLARHLFPHCLDGQPLLLACDAQRYGVQSVPVADSAPYANCGW